MYRIASALVVVAAGLGFVAAEEPKRHVEAAGGFSFVPPAGWKSKAMKGFKYQVVFGPAADLFAPNFNAADETFKGTLKEYADHSDKAMAKAFKEYKLVKRDEFAAADKLPGERLVIEHRFDGTRLRQIFYLFADGDRKVVVTGSALAKDGDKFDKTFDDSLKTFRFEKK